MSRWSYGLLESLLYILLLCHHFLYGKKEEHYPIKNSDYINLISYNLKGLHYFVFVIVELQTVFHIQFVGMFIKYLCIKFHMPSSASLVIYLFVPEIRIWRYSLVL